MLLLSIEMPPRWGGESRPRDRSQRLKDWWAVPTLQLEIGPTESDALVGGVTPPLRIRGGTG